MCHGSSPFHIRIWVSGRSFPLQPYYCGVGYAKCAGLRHDFARPKLAHSSRSQVGIPLRLAADRTDDIADGPTGGKARAEAAGSAQRCRGMNLGDRLAETRDHVGEWRDST
jgi:hypothetical protein